MKKFVSKQVVFLFGFGEPSIRLMLILRYFIEQEDFNRILTKFICFLVSRLDFLILSLAIGFIVGC